MLPKLYLISEVGSKHKCNLKYLRSFCSEDTDFLACINKIRPETKWAYYKGESVKVSI